MSSGRIHWLVGLARSEGLGGSEGLDVPAGAPIAEAWHRVADAAGLSQPELAERVARRFRLDVADLSQAELKAVRLLPDSVARGLGVCPVREDERRLVVATADPMDLDAEQKIQFASGRSVRFEVAWPEVLSDAIEFHYSPDRAAERILERMDHELADSLQVIQVDAAPEEIDEEAVGTGPVVRLTNIVLQEAIENGASDIHLQPTGHGGVVRYRVDGVLRNAGHMPLSVLNRVVSRIKVMARLDIADRLRPQDGRTRVAVGDRAVDLRVSTVPTRTSEKAVIRILDSTGVKTLEGIGFPEPERRRLAHLLSHRDGIVVVTGPTGSGKTTTMYASLQHIHDENINIMTVEDPVEFDLPGFTQIQVEPKKGVTFASALRAILRQDPDVIFVGEIRDGETAGIAVQASLTGHVVLATLHTNDAAGSIRRLTDLGLDAPAINETLRGAVAQRLARRVCTECAEPVEGELTTDEQRLAEEFGEAPTVRAVGCNRCGRIGYRGRVPVVQVMTMTPELRDLVSAEAAPDVVREAARNGGMRTLREAGLDLVRAGLTTLEELERVLGDIGGGSQAVATDRGALPTTPSDQVEDGAVHVLLVDDDGANRTIARALLESEGFRVTEARDGVEAMDVVERVRDLGLVVLDLDMPRMDGAEVLERIRRTMRTAGLPVVVLTGSTSEESEFQAMEAGADDYLRKPFDPRRFVLRVRAALRRAAV